MMNSQVSYFLHALCDTVLRLKYSWLRRLVDRLTGLENEGWSRVIMRRSYQQILAELQPHQLAVLEISGDHYAKQNFKRYRAVHHPEYDICTMLLPEEFDLIIAEQVFEHLPWPYRAGKNVYQMLKPGGHFLISTPFMVRIHNEPIDCTRWTETGLKYFLAECGFPSEKVKTSSMGESSMHQGELYWMGALPAQDSHTEQ
jgi:SAM-dependent methyltransferase